MDNNGASLWKIVGLIKSIATKIAKQYESIGITGIRESEGGLIISFTPPTPDSIVPLSHIMAVSKYVGENGTGSVRNANKLNEQTADFYTSAANINYNNSISGLQSTTIQNAIGEIVNILATQLADIISCETNIGGLQTSVTNLEGEVATTNLGIYNIIKGDYIGVEGTLGINKNTDGVKINSNIIDSQINLNTTNISTLTNNVNANTNAITQANTKILNNHNEIISHLTSNSPHIGVLEEVVNKGIANGYAPLNADGKIPSQHLVLPISQTSYMLAEESVIRDPITSIAYRQRCSATTDIRYSNITQTLTRDVTASAGTWQIVLGSITDPTTAAQSVSNLVSMTALVINVPFSTATINARIDFYKRSGTLETIIGVSTENVLNLTTSPTTFYFNTQLSQFTLAVGDSIVMKVLMKKSSTPTISTRISVEGTNGTNTIFSGIGLNGGSSSAVSVNDVVGLPQVFNGATAIDDIKLNGQAYKLSDFMEIALKQSETTSYVSNGSLNGTGNKFTPYGTLEQAFTAISQIGLTPNLEVIESGDYPLPITYSTASVEKFFANKSKIIGALIVSKANAIYDIMELQGDLTISAENSIIKLNKMIGNIIINSNCTLLIQGEFNGTIEISPLIKPYLRINKITTSMLSLQLTELAVLDGSVIGKYIYGMVSVS